MKSPRIFLARVLELGVRVSWREAVAIVREAVARTAATEGAPPTRVTAEVAPVSLRELVAAANAAADVARAMADADEQDPLKDFDDVIAAPTPAASPTALSWPSVTALAPPSAIPMLDDQTVARLGDSAVGDAEVRRPGLDEVAPVSLRELVAAANAEADVDDVIGAPTPAASPTDLSWPSVTALAPPSAIPMLDDQTVARLGDSAVGDAEVRRPGLDEVAPVSLRELVAAANAAPDAARAMADRDEQHPWGDFDDFIAAPTPAASPTDLSWPSVTALAPPSAIPMLDDQTVARLGDSAVGNAEIRRPSLDHADLSAAVEAGCESTAKDVRGGYASPFHWVKRASPAALVCSVLAVAAGGILVLQMPATRRSAVEPSEPSEPSIEPPEIGAPVGLESQTPRTRPDPARLPEVADPPSVPPSVARSAPRDSPRIEVRRAPSTRAQDSFVRPIPPPAAGPEAPVESTATVAGSRSLSTTSAADAILAPDAANPAGAPPPAVDPSSVVASATASSPAEMLGSASTAVPVNAVARSPGRESEARAIENVLGRYRIAFNKLDAGAAVAVWPTVNEKTLARAFERLESHEVSFETCQIEIFAALAEAACSGSTRYVPKVGSRTPKDEARRWRFSLRKASGGWLIDRVDAR